MREYNSLYDPAVGPHYVTTNRAASLASKLDLPTTTFRRLMATKRKNDETVLPTHTRPAPTGPPSPEEGRLVIDESPPSPTAQQPLCQPKSRPWDHRDPRVRQQSRGHSGLQVAPQALPLHTSTSIWILSPRVTIRQDIFQHIKRDTRTGEAPMDEATLATMDQDLNSLMDDHDDAEEIRVFMAEEPKIKVTDSLAMSIQMDRASEPPRWRN